MNFLNIRQYPLISLTCYGFHLLRLVQHNLKLYVPRHIRLELLLMRLIDIPYSARNSPRPQTEVLEPGRVNDGINLEMRRRLSKNGFLGFSKLSIKNAFRCWRVCILERFLYFAGDPVLYPQKCKE